MIASAAETLLVSRAVKRPGMQAGAGHGRD